MEKERYDDTIVNTSPISSFFATQREMKTHMEFCPPGVVCRRGIILQILFFFFFSHELIFDVVEVCNHLNYFT